MSLVPLSTNLVYLRDIAKEPSSKARKRMADLLFAVGADCPIESSTIDRLIRLESDEVVARVLGELGG